MENFKQGMKVIAIKQPRLITATGIINSAGYIGEIETIRKVDNGKFLLQLGHDTIAWHLACDWKIYKEEKTLSDRIVTSEELQSQIVSNMNFLHIEWVKEYIKKVDKVLCFAIQEKAGYYDFSNKKERADFLNEWIIKPIKKLTGDKLQ